MTNPLRRLLVEDDGQDIAEYAVMLAVILVIVVGTIRLIGSNANNAFSAAASSIPVELPARAVTNGTERKGEHAQARRVPQSLKFEPGSVRGERLSTLARVTKFWRVCTARMQS